MKIFFAVLAFILMLGMIGDKNPDDRWNYTIGFIITVVAIVVLYALESLAVIL